MKYRVEITIEQQSLNVAADKSRSMINALEREQVGNIINTALSPLFEGVEITTVRKINQMKRSIA